MAPRSDHLFCFGFGYTTARLARGLLREGWRVTGTHRDPAAATALGREPPPDPASPGRLTGLPFSDDTPLPPGALEGVTHVLVSVPPGPEGDAVLRHHAEDLAALAPRWVGLLSTTGVYGDTGGAWVDEGSPCRPTQERSKRRLVAEEAWLTLARDQGLPLHIFRLAGIYGPGRSPFDQLRSGRAQCIDKPGHVFSRVHVDDIGLVLRASMDSPDPGAIYNVCDDEPVEPARVIEAAATLLGITPPPLQPFETVAPTLSPMALSFWADNRRVRNDRLFDDLGLSLYYPSYQQGLEAILAEEEGRVPPGPPTHQPRSCG